jgi:F-type H+-transporting ATPase subunit b
VANHRACKPMNMSRFIVALLTVVGCATLGPLDVALEGVALRSAAAQPHGVDSHGETAHSETAHSETGDGETGDSETGDSETGHDGASSHANTNPLSVDPDLMLFTLIIFALLLGVLGKFAWVPIREALERREQSIADQIAEAQRSRDEARRLLEEHELKIASAHDEIRGLMDDARKEADQQRHSIIADAERVAADQQARAILEIDAAKHAAIEELAKTEVHRVVDLAGRIVGKELKPDDHASLIADAIKHLPSEN